MNPAMNPRHCPTCTCHGPKLEVGVCKHCRRDIYSKTSYGGTTTWYHAHDDNFLCGRDWLFEINKAAPAEKEEIPVSPTKIEIIIGSVALVALSIIMIFMWIHASTTYFPVPS